MPDLAPDLDGQPEGDQHVSTEPAVNASYVNVPFLGIDGTVDQVTVVAEGTDTPGLVITPELKRGWFSGGFCLTHAQTGKTLPVETFGADVAAARRVAAELGKVGIDWTMQEDRLAEAVAGRGKEIREAISRGRWTYDPAADTTSDGKHQLGEFPKTEADATATNMAAHLVRIALQRYTDGWELIHYDRSDTQARARHFDNIEAMCADYGIIAVLHALMQIDPVAADGIARDLWYAYDAGDSVGEELAAWGAEYGIPVPKTASPGVKPPAGGTEGSADR